ncbi:MAG: hypothetical protein Q4B70_14410 [Lachnospiraceae bacterium]|nr:hypothetical protein [Lachnospiraceae bacterium]
MRVKVKIISALAHHPHLLILDEPTAGLDPIARNEILQLLKYFVTKKQGSILISSHITTDLDNLADSIVFIHKGKLIFTKTMEQVQAEGGVEAVMLAYVKDDNAFLSSLNDESSDTQNDQPIPRRGFVRPSSPAGRSSRLGQR